jgi:predicted lipid-binding transport protein (Tim44 family)
MNQVFDPFNIIILAIAVIIFFRLRSVLGTRTGNEKSFDPFGSSKNDNAPAANSDNVVPLPGQNKRQDAEVSDSADEQPPLWEGFAKKGSAVAKGLEQISAADASFTPREFLDGARTAYEMIVTAFSEGSKSALKPLLSREVFDGFASAIDERKQAGQTLESKFVGINRADIVKADVSGGLAQVTVKFVSDLISATRDNEGRVIDGDPNEIQEITDVWTFERPVASSDPNWRLIATEDD